MRVYLEPRSIRDHAAATYFIDVDAVTPRSRRLIRRVYRLARLSGTSALVARWHVVELLTLDTSPVTDDRLAVAG